MTSPAEAVVLFTTDRGIGRITLNRPKAINALNHPMVKAISTVLSEWSRTTR